MIQTSVIQNSVLIGQALCQTIDAICQNCVIPVMTVGNHSPAYHFPNLPEPTAKYEQSDREPVCFWPQFDWHVLFAKAMAEVNDKLGFICVRPDERATEIIGFQLTDSVLMMHFPSKIYEKFQGALYIEESPDLCSFLYGICQTQSPPVVIVPAIGSAFSRKLLSTINPVIRHGLLIGQAHGDLPPLFSKQLLADLRHTGNIRGKLRYVKHLSWRLFNVEKEKALYGKIAHLWVPTGQSREHWAEFTRCPISLTTSGYDADFWKPSDKFQARKQLNLPNDLPVILSSSVLIPKKRLDDLIRASAIVRGKIGNLRLIISGYGEKSERQRLLEITRQANMQDCTLFTGYVTDVQLLTYYNAADVFVHLSAVEGGPTSCEIALGTNLPVVMTPVGSAGEFIQKFSLGKFFPVGDVAACANQIIETLQTRNPPVTADAAREMLSWQSRAPKMAADIENVWQKSQAKC